MLVSDSQSNGYTRNCISYLKNYSNFDNMNLFKQQIKFTNINLPIVDVVIECLDEYKKAIMNKSIDQANLQEKNIEHLTPCITSYFKHFVDEGTFESWGALKQISHKPELKLKNTFISIEFLLSVKLEDVDKKAKIQEWLDQAAPSLNELNDGKKEKLHEIVSNLSKELAQNDRKGISKTIKAAKEILHKIA